MNKTDFNTFWNWWTQINADFFAFLDVEIGYRLNRLTNKWSLIYSRWLSIQAEGKNRRWLDGCCVNKMRMQRGNSGPIYLSPARPRLPVSCPWPCLNLGIPNQCGLCLGCLQAVFEVVSRPCLRLCPGRVRDVSRPCSRSCPGRVRTDFRPCSGWL